MKKGVKKFSRNTKIIFLLSISFILFAGIVYAIATGTASSGYTISSGSASSIITIYNGATYGITNSLASAIFVPTKTAAEWSAFSSYRPSGVSICSPINGGWGSWSAQQTCGSGASAVCGSQTLTQTRSCNNPPPSCGGGGCSGSSTQTYSISCDGSCGSGQYCRFSGGSYSCATCTATCSTYSGSYSCGASFTVLDPCNAGKDLTCTGTMQNCPSGQTCSGGTCVPTCTATNAHWGACSVSCGGGTKTCIAATCGGDNTCHSPTGAAGSTTSCNTQACCSPVNSYWGACSVSCGGGTRTCYGGTCGGSTSTCTPGATGSCNTQSCSSCVHCSGTCSQGVCFGSGSCAC